MRCERFWPLYFKFMLSTVLSAVTLMVFSMSIGFVITGHFTTKYLYRSFKLVSVLKYVFNLSFTGFVPISKQFTFSLKKHSIFTISSLPWDQNTPFGYVGEILYCIVVGEAYFISNGMFLLLLIALCVHHQAFSKMFECSVQKFDQTDANQDDHEYLADLIEFHISIKR